MIVFLEHKFSLVNQGYQFYESHVHPEDLDMLEQINNVAFDFFYTLKQEQRKHVTIVYDIRLKEISGKYILVNHHLTPLTLADDGKIETALCMISPASNQYPGNVYIRNIKTKTIIEYNPKLNYFGEITHQNLTRQQCSMLEQIAKGHTESQIAELFNISINTVKSHKKDIFKKLSIFNIAAVLQWFNNQKKI